MNIRSDLPRLATPLNAVAVLCLVIAGVVAATSYAGRGPETAGPSKTKLARSEPADSDPLSRLNDYVRSIEVKAPAAKPAADPILPDVSTMIERLAARLETKPSDVKGWRMLGWSYYQLERYDEAAKALERAIVLDPNSAELKLVYEEAKAKASGNQIRGNAPSGDGLHADKNGQPADPAARE